MQTATKTTNEIAALFDSAPIMFKREQTRHPYCPNKRLKPSQEYRFDGQGGFAVDSGRIPWRARVGAAVFIIGCAVLVKVGAVVFY